MENKYIVTAIMAVAVLWQGGFYDMTWCVFGIFCAVNVFWFAKKLPPRSVAVPVFALVLLYFVSALTNGAHYESFRQSIRPLVIFFALIALCNAQKLDVAFCIRVSGIFAVIMGLAALAGIIAFPGAWSANRLQGTFQYANAAGIFFAVCAFLARSERWRGIWLAPLFEIALLLTQSVGALLMYAFGWFLWLLTRKRWKSCLGLFFAGMTAGIVLLQFRAPGRIMSSYLERLIQIHDGLSAMLSHPFGIGPGLWSVRVLELQSAFYTANHMHSFFAEVAAETGILGLGLLVFLFISRLAHFFRVSHGPRREKLLTPRRIAAGMLLLHGAVDITFDFLSLVLLFLLLTASDTEDGPAFPKAMRIAGCAATLMFGAFMTFNIGVENAETWKHPVKSPSEIIMAYEGVKLKNARAHYEYAEALTEYGRYEEAAEFALLSAEKSPYMIDGYELLAEILPYLPESERAYYNTSSAAVLAKAKEDEHPLYKYLFAFKEGRELE
jgi:O-antigen ligase